jgi:HEAT repeat protein
MRTLSPDYHDYLIDSIRTGWQREDVPLLIKTLEESRTDTSASAAFVLGLVGRNNKETLPALAKALKSSDSNVRANAASALGKMGLSSSQASHYLHECLRDTDEEVLIEAAAVLAKINSQDELPTNLLVKSLRHENPNTRSITAWAIGETRCNGDQIFSALIASLEDPDIEVRISVLWALGQIDWKTRSIAPMITMLDDEDERVRLFAAAALSSRLDSTNEEAVPGLMRVLKEVKGFGEERHPESALKNIGKPAVSGLTKALFDSDPIFRERAAWTLGSIGSDAKEAVSALRSKTFRDPAENVRSTAKEALEKITTESSNFQR